MKPHKGLLWFAVPLLSTACTIPTQISPTIEIVDIPKRGVVCEAELGDTIISKGTISTYDGIQLEQDILIGGGFGSEQLEFPAQKLAAMAEDKMWTYYYGGQNVNVIRGALGMGITTGGMRIRKGDPAEMKVFTPLTYDVLTPSKPVRYKPCRVQAPGRPGFLQELIYNGKSGNTVRFLYRELAGDVLRPAFTQEAQYDLADGSVVGFKGARVEIIDAANTKLRYRVFETFPERSSGVAERRPTEGAESQSK